MSEDQNKLNSNLSRTAILSVALVLSLYVGSFTINTYSGGYWDQLERDGRDRHSFSLSVPTAILWQPYSGFWTPYRSDWVGFFYSPLIRLDRLLLHRTHYVSDQSFDSWTSTAPASVWHPLSRTALAQAPKKQQ